MELRVCGWGAGEGVDDKRLSLVKALVILVGL